MRRQNLHAALSTTISVHVNRATGALSVESIVPHSRRNQEQTPHDLQMDRAIWEDLGGPYDTFGTTIPVQLTDQANEFAIADAVRVERIADVSAAPEIDDFIGSTEIVDGGEVQLGTTTVGSPVEAVVTGRNDGAALYCTVTPADSPSLGG